VSPRPRPNRAPNRAPNRHRARPGPVPYVVVGPTTTFFCRGWPNDDNPVAVARFRITGSGVRDDRRDRSGALGGTGTLKASKPA